MTTADFQPQLPENALPTWTFPYTEATVIGSGPSAMALEDWDSLPRPLVAMSSGIRVCKVKPDYWFLVDPHTGVSRSEDGSKVRWKLYGEEGTAALDDPDILKVRPIFAGMVEPYWVPDIQHIYEEDIEMIGNTMPWAVRSLVKWGCTRISFLGCDMTSEYPHMSLLSDVVKSKVHGKREEAILSIAAIDDDVEFVNLSDPDGLLKWLDVLRQPPPG